MKKILTLVLLLLAPSAFAQNAIIQDGAVVNYDVGVFRQDRHLQGSSKVQNDNNRGVNPFRVRDNNGPGICFDIDKANGTVNPLCFGHNANGNPVYTVSGIEYAFGGAGLGNVTGPLSSVVGNVMCSNSVTGTLIKDCGTGITITTSATATPGVTAKIDNLFELNSAGTASYLGTNFPGQLYIQTAFGNKLNNTMAGAGTGSGYFGLLYALKSGGYSNNSSGGIATPIGAWVNVTNSGDRVSAANFAVTVDSGITPASMGGAECDLAANAGSTISAGVGTCYFAYAYNKTYNNAYFAGTGDSGTGRFTNGYVIGNSAIATTGTGVLFGGLTQTMSAGIDFGSSLVTFSNSALHLYPLQKIKFDAGGGVGISNQYIAANGNLIQTVPNTGATISWRDFTDTATVATLTNVGAFSVAGLLTGGSTTLLASSVTLTNGAGAQTPTMTNSPTAGNPTKWVGINDNGTTRWIPTWQ